MKVEEMVSKSGKPMIKVYLDTAPNDKQPKFFLAEYNGRQAPEDGSPKKWPNAGTIYILIEDKDGNCNGRLKGFITAVEESNPGFSVQWGDAFAACFKGKLVGGVVGKELDEYQGKEVERHKVRYFCSIAKVPEVKPPKVIETDAWKMMTGAINPASKDPEFMTVADEELPFM
jgi:hypothetical protein